MFYLSSVGALFVSALATLFYVAAGAGFVLDLLGACSVGLLLSGVLLNVSNAKLGCKLSALGAGVSAIVVLFGIAEVVRPSLEQPGQKFLLLVPGIFLLVLVLHLASVRSRWGEIESEALMNALKSASIDSKCR